jgi:heat-inducible transcriptional repressor
MIHSELSEREKGILRYIVQQFILTASPVGSRLITKKYNLGLSPATVRNIMADLEDGGYLDHPHTSAGRVPTDKGYRMYVDSLMQTKQLENSEKEEIHRTLEEHLNETDELLVTASKLLSSITNQLACVVYPRIEGGTLEKIQLVSLSSVRLLIVISIKSGLVKTITLEIDSEVKESQLQSVQSLLNEKLAGLTLSEIRATFKERLQDSTIDAKPILNIFYDSVDKIFTDIKRNERAVVSGAKNLIKHPEFEAPDKFGSVVELLEEHDIIVHIFESDMAPDKENISVVIGGEIPDQRFEDYSYVSKKYKVGNTMGKLGIVGPKRMEYSKIVAIVDYLSKALTDYLTK